MKLTEITAAEFQEKLKDPEVAQVSAWAKEIDTQVNKAFKGPWQVNVTNPHPEMYADKFINIHRMTDYRPSTEVLNGVFNIAAQIIAIPSLHDVKWGHDNKFVSKDIQIDIAFGREGLYTRYSTDELEKQRMNR